MRTFTSIAVGLVLVVMSVQVGCMGKAKPEGLPNLSPCKITLTQGGSPASGVLLTLYSETPGECPWVVSGTTDESGVATIRTHGEYNGAPQGTFKVVLAKTETEGADPNAEVQTKTIKVYTLVNKDLTDRKTTSLSITVNGGTTNESFDIGPAVHDLISTIKPGEF